MNGLMQKSYAGFGSRETPSEICRMMRNMARCLADNGYMLRSGGSGNADLSFEQGVNSNLGKEIYVPWNNFRDNSYDISLARLRSETRERAMQVAKEHHPRWRACSDGARKLHARNALIVFGARMNEPVEFGICWTSNGKDKGGTGLGIRICLANDIPVYNLRNVEDRGRMLSCFEWSGAFLSLPSE